MENFVVQLNESVKREQWKEVITQIWAENGFLNVTLREGETKPEGHEFEPIGVMRTVFKEKFGTPR